MPLRLGFRAPGGILGHRIRGLLGLGLDGGWEGFEVLGLGSNRVLRARLPAACKQDILLVLLGDQRLLVVRVA